MMRTFSLRTYETKIPVRNEMSHPRRASIQKQVNDAFVSTPLLFGPAVRLALGFPSFVYNTMVI